MAAGLMHGAHQPLRLLMLSHYFEERRGGIEMVAAALAQELAHRGMEVTWLAAGGANGNGNGNGVRRECRRGALAASGVLERWLHIPYPLPLPSAWRAIFHAAAYHDVILVHDALYLTSVIASLAARAFRKPLVVVQHVGFVPYRSALLRTLMRAANRCIARPLLRCAAQVVFISQLTMRQFGHLPWRRPPVLIFNGVDTNTFSPALRQSEVEDARRSVGLPCAVPVALFVGRFVEKKGLHVLEKLAHSRSDVLFALAGHGALDPELWRLPNVRVYTGLFGATLATLYRASDLLLLPSVGEGLPLVIQEALACGLAVVCGADTAGADSRAATFLNGVEVNLADPDLTAHLFSAEMTRVLGCPRTPESRRERAAFARANYSWAGSAASYANILEKLRLAAAR